MKIQADVKWWYFLIVIILFAGFYYVGRQKGSVEKKNLVQALKHTSDTVSSYKVKIKGLDQMVFNNSTMILTLKEAIQSGIIEQERLKKLNIKNLRTTSHLQGQIRVLKDSLKIDNTKIIYVDKNDISSACIELPTSLNYKDNYVSFDIKLNENASWNFDLTVPLDLKVTVANKVTVTTPNPYVHLNKINTVVIPEKKSFFSKPVFKWIAGGAIFSAGVWVGSK